MHKIVFIIAIAVLMTSQANASAPGGNVPTHQHIPDYQQLTDFYSFMGDMYSKLKLSVDDYLGEKITTEEYVSQMKKWSDEAASKDLEAPCPDNDKWKAYYTELTPIHLNVCMAWGDLNALYSSLMMTDDVGIELSQGNFSRSMQDIERILYNPRLNADGGER